MKKSVFVTGASQGTGYAIAERFAKEGYDVFIGGRNGETAQESAEKLMEKYGVFAKGYTTVVFDENNVKEIFADIRANGYLLDCIVFNAANLGIGQVSLEVDMQDFMNVFQTNIGW
ncbi:MAG: SDR family NAD(P)-dependent oxidoreductase, partial [Clostridia bacterium]|nr:SDR family NAD(P)-dependent oxidoreductase [Clostridia bacterium]